MPSRSVIINNPSADVVGGTALAETASGKGKSLSVATIVIICIFSVLIALLLLALIVWRIRVAREVSSSYVIACWWSRVEPQCPLLAPVLSPVCITLWHRRPIHCDGNPSVCAVKGECTPVSLPSIFCVLSGGWPPRSIPHSHIKCHLRSRTQRHTISPLHITSHYTSQFKEAQFAVDLPPPKTPEYPVDHPDYTTQRVTAPGESRYEARVHPPAP